MLSNNKFEHSSNDHLLLFTLLLSLSVEYVGVLLKRAFVFVRACECVLLVVAAAAVLLNCIRDDEDDGARMLFANDVRSGGGGGACTKCIVFDCVR